MPDDEKGLDTGGAGATAYAEAVSVYLALAVDRLAMTGNNLVRWNGVGEKWRNTASDDKHFRCYGTYAEPNFFGTSTGCFDSALLYSYDPLTSLPQIWRGMLFRQTHKHRTESINKIISTDPPYYNNIFYADLSDFFYVWLRKIVPTFIPVALRHDRGA